jgi:hypothetical protein
VQYNDTGMGEGMFVDLPMQGVVADVVERDITLTRTNVHISELAEPR